MEIRCGDEEGTGEIIGELMGRKSYIGLVLLLQEGENDGRYRNEIEEDYSQKLQEL